MKERVKRTMKMVTTIVLALAMIAVAVPVKKSDAKVNIKYGTFSYAYNKGKAVWMIDLKKAKNNKVKIGIVWSDSKKSFDTGKHFTKKLASKVSFNVKGKYLGSKKTKTIKGSITFKGKKLKCVINGQKFTAKYVPDDPSRDDPEQDVWVTATDPSIQEGVQAKFDIINKADNGTTFTPIATFATMISAEGTKWRVFAKETNNMPGGKSYYTILEITEYPDASVAITRQYTTMLGDLDAGTAGGWSLCASPVLDSSLSPKLNDLASQLTGGLDGVSITPLAQVAEKVVAGKSFLIACERKAVTPSANPTYFFVTVTVGLDGTVTVDKDSIVNVYMDDPA